MRDPEEQIDKLAQFIMENIPGEPSESEGAVDTAIRLLGSLEYVGWEYMSKGGGVTRQWLEIDTPWEPELRPGEKIVRKNPVYVIRKNDD